MEEEQPAFSCLTDSETKRRLLGDKVPKPSISGYRVFVQNIGSGARHLPAGSELLYENELQNSSTSSSEPDPPLKRILSSHFKLTPLTSKVTIAEFCDKERIPKDYSIFLELGKFEKKSDLIDVILQDKSTGLRYSGPTARKMVKEYYKGCQDPELDKWRVFVLCEFDKDMELLADTEILHQARGCTQTSVENYHVLAVDGDRCMCMSDFIQKRPDIAEFTNGDAFYEFTKEEDLQYYKDIVHLPLVEGNVSVYTGIDLFYRLPGVTGVGVKPQAKEGVRVFIQSTSQGARCVKPGDTILYKKK